MEEEEEERRRVDRTMEESVQRILRVSEGNCRREGLSRSKTQSLISRDALCEREITTSVKYEGVGSKSGRVIRGAQVDG